MEDTTSTTTDTSTAASVDAASSETTAQPQTAETKAPRSFGEAVDQLKAQDEAASTTGEPATTAQETPTVKAEDKPPSKKGPIPFDVHEKALTNARSKAVEEAKPQIEQALRQQYAWSDDIEAPDREELTALYRGLKTDLIGTLTTLIDNASQHPDHAKTLRSQAARLLNAARRVQGDTASDDDEPQPDIPLEDGRAVYSAEQQRVRDAWLIKQVRSEFQQELKPFKDDREKAAETERKRAAWDQAGELLAKLKAKPHFTEHKAEINALMEANPEWSVSDAYNEVLITKVLPKASQTERAAVLADIHHKAGAGTLNPQQTTTATQIKPDGKFTVDRVRQFFEAGA